MRLAIFASGRGTNFQAIAEHARMGILKNVEVSLLITNDANAPAVTLAREYHIPTASFEGIQGRKFSTKQERERVRNEFDRQALEALHQNRIDLVALAGFMQVLSNTLVDPYEYRIMNIHPAIDLAKFGGRGMHGEHVHEAVIRAGEKKSGCTIHYVDESVDGGPIIIQSIVPVESTDTPESLARRILVHEHRTYPKAIQLNVDERIKIVNGKAHIDWSGNWIEEWNRRQEALIENEQTPNSR